MISLPTHDILRMLSQSKCFHGFPETSLRQKLTFPKENFGLHAFLCLLCGQLLPGVQKYDNKANVKACQGIEDYFCLCPVFNLKCTYR